ncbi:uncharacterized protein LOC131649677 [Vicia villosa]|uniref:uncharacterized protein LOC131649677 n=1 Tax=Vicia villosa TaxID=3911 RepID=UPI00273B42FC|nr:uncharacterized protein LOC131649677 [Vicia villosa]
MTYLLSSLTKNTFTWFTMLAPNSVRTWEQLERVFHEQFYMGQSKISLKELSLVKRKSSESIDDYLNMFRLLKAKCFIKVPENELIKMGSTNRTPKDRKVRASKSRKREKIAYVENDEYPLEWVDEYVCKVLKPSKGKSVEEPKNDRVTTKTYTFDITKCDEIFDVLVSDGQIEFGAESIEIWKVVVW